MDGVERFYDQNLKYEWERLERHRTEFAVTMRALGDYLPKPPGRSSMSAGGRDTMPSPSPTGAMR